MGANLGRLLRILALAAIASTAAATAAFAEGGPSIAQAPVIVPGQQEFGNTANGTSTNNSCGEAVRSQWWMLPVTSGDHVAIDWEEPESIRHVWSGLIVYPPGTTDFNYPQTRSVLTSELNSNGKNEAKFVATQSGSMPVLVTASRVSCESGTPAPYSFTVYITHALNVALPHASTLRLKGTLAIGLHTPEGGSVNDPSLSVEVQISLRGVWHTIGVSRDGDSVAVVHYTIPRSAAHKHVALRVLAHGPEYEPATSAHVKVRVL
jgi:hypothetical protein